MLNAITDLIGKTLMFGVYVGKDNVDYGSHICNIGKTWSADEIISESDDENSEDTLTNGVSSDRSSGQVYKFCMFFIFLKHIYIGDLNNVVCFFVLGIFHHH